MEKKLYAPPELEVLKIRLLLDILTLSNSDIGHDKIDNGDGSDLFGDDDGDPDSNFDDYDLGDGDGLFD